MVNWQKLINTRVTWFKTRLVRCQEIVSQKKIKYFIKHESFKKRKFVDKKKRNVLFFVLILFFGRLHTFLKKLQTIYEIRVIFVMVINFICSIFFSRIKVFIVVEPGWIFVIRTFISCGIKLNRILRTVLFKISTVFENAFSQLNFLMACLISPVFASLQCQISCK